MRRVAMGFSADRAAVQVGEAVYMDASQSHRMERLYGLLCFFSFFSLFFSSFVLFLPFSIPGQVRESLKISPVS